MIDLHCHILPGLDDGAPDLDTALAMAEIALEDGIRTIVATPHVSVGGAVTPEIIRTATRELNEALNARGLPLTVLPGAEVECGPEVMRVVRQGGFLTLADRGKYLLLEPPLIGIITYLEQLCFQLQIAQLTPVLAHPERTQLCQQHPELYERLAAHGCLIQVNSSSIRGYDGRAIRKRALAMIRDGRAHILASDAHNTSSRAPRLSDVRQAVTRASDEHSFVEMTRLVPSNILSSCQEQNR